MNEIIYDGGLIGQPSDPSAGRTSFAEVYNRFLGKITDDMYMEITPEETLQDLQSLLINAIPGFEFPRIVLDDFVLALVEIPKDQVEGSDFIIGEVEDSPFLLVERSYFSSKLSSEEINILAILMLEGWVQRQLTSVEVTRMKYSGPDFKLTSQANHLSKLLNLLKEVQRQSLHMQRLYKRRKVTSSGHIASNWSVLREVSAIDD